MSFARFVAVAFVPALALACVPALLALWAGDGWPIALMVGGWTFTGYQFGWTIGHHAGTKRARLFVGIREGAIVDAFQDIFPALGLEDAEEAREAARQATWQTLTVVTRYNADQLVYPLIMKATSRRWRAWKALTGQDPAAGLWYISRTPSPTQHSVGVTLEQQPPNPLEAIKDIPDYPPEPDAK